MYIDIVFELPIERTFTYSVPGELYDKLALYKRVEAPLKSMKKKGIIVNIHNEKPEFTVKDIFDVIDEIPLLDNNAYKISKWMKDFYLCSTGEALFTMIPREKKEKVDLLEAHEIKSLYELNEEQSNAVSKIKQTIDNNAFKAFLLYGITGSGKTEVYRHVAKYLKNLGKSTIILVPEISLTPQTIRRFSEIFGDRIAVIHSRLNPREKLYHWHRIQNNEVDIILGARSAIFAPAKNLGCIIIDEEHETSYKSSDTPRYNAKQVAFYLANTRKIPLILGSATPQLESFFHALHGNIELLTMKNRFAKEQNSNVSIVNMKGVKSILHPKLVEKVVDKLNKGEQTILFLNRRGFSKYILCDNCGHSITCKNCSVTMTYHKRKNLLICHTCGLTSKIPSICPECKSSEIDYIGTGTEKIEETIEKTFPNARVERMDLDTTRGKKGHEKILDRLAKKEIDILIGTQMIAKGLHFPTVTLVGIIDADVALHLPDFRASERIFSLLTQVSGRAGRGLIQGDVIIQTRTNSNYVIELAAKNDYELFYNNEIEIRKITNFPPFSKIIRLVLRGKKEQDVSRKIQDAVFSIGKTNGVELLGPSECTFYKVNKNFRWNFLLRGNNTDTLLKLAKKYQEYFLKDKSVYLEIDAFPLNML